MDTLLLKRCIVHLKLYFVFLKFLLGVSRKIKKERERETEGEEMKWEEEQWLWLEVVRTYCAEFSLVLLSSFSQQFYIFLHFFFPNRHTFSLTRDSFNSFPRCLLIIVIILTENLWIFYKQVAQIYFVRSLIFVYSLFFVRSFFLSISITSCRIFPQNPMIFVSSRKQSLLTLQKYLLLSSIYSPQLR